MLPINGRVMLSKLLQPSNAASPILVTLSGITIFFKLLQSTNAASPILVPPDIITSFSDAGTKSSFFEYELAPNIYPK